MLQEINGNWNVGVLEHPFGRGINFQIETSDLDGLVARLQENKITPFKDVFESKYRQNEIIHTEKEILIQDPDGYLLRFSMSF